MRRQPRSSRSPPLPKTNISYSISLKHGYLKYKQTIIDQYRRKPTLEERRSRRLATDNHRKRTVSVLDSSDAMEQRLKFPALVKDHQSCLKVYEEPSIIKDNQSPPSIKTQRKQVLTIPSNIVNTLHRKPSHRRLPQCLQAKSKSNSYKTKKIRLDEYSLQQMQSGVGSKKRRNQAQFKIQPWEANRLLGGTLPFFRKLQ